MKTSEELQEEFGIDGVVRISDCAESYPVIYIENTLASAEIALHGAHVMRYQPANEKPVLWLSDTAVYRAGKAIRGGIPVCWPWFSAHPDDGSLPAHGVARSRFWTLEAIETLASGETHITLALLDSPETLTQWPYAFRFVLTVTVGRELTVALTATNTSNTACTCSGALHSYFAIADITQARLSGLDGVEYIDQLLEGRRLLQRGDIVIDEEFDAIYQDTQDDVVIIDQAGERDIRVSRAGSRSVVIWNPWIKKSSGMADFHKEGYQQMVCVEAANAGDDTVLLEPGESHTLSTTIAVETWDEA